MKSTQPSKNAFVTRSAAVKRWSRPGPACYSPGPIPTSFVGIHAAGASTVTAAPTAAAPGSLVLRPGPAALASIDLQPPTIAAAGDPFTAARVLALVACIERGRPALIDDIAAALNARHLDWAFSSAVVADVVLQLQANWMADYRNGSGILVEDGPYGATLTIEDSSRVDPWIVRRVEREIAACQVALTDFSRRSGGGFDD